MLKYFIRTSLKKNKKTIINLSPPIIIIHVNLSNLVDSNIFIFIYKLIKLDFIVLMHIFSSKTYMRVFHFLSTLDGKNYSKPLQKRLMKSFLKSYQSESQRVFGLCVDSYRNKSCYLGHLVKCLSQQKFKHGRGRHVLVPILCFKVKFHS